METHINGYTKVLGIIGNPVEHSFSPFIHNTLSSKLHLNYVYVPFRVSSEELQYAVRGFKAAGVAGFNVTIPHKKNVIRYLDNVSKEALLMGAVNTVKNMDGKLFGYNTDGEGFIKSLSEEGVSVKGKNVLILGAGGAARGIAIKIALEGADSIVVLNRTPEKACEISTIINDNIRHISKYDVLNKETLLHHGISCDILINTTPLGMYPDINQCPVEDMDFLHPGIVVCDLIYNPLKTVFLEKAEKKGCKIINGLGMLLFQAISSFQIWTGIRVTSDIYKNLQKNVFKEGFFNSL